MFGGSSCIMTTVDKNNVEKSKFSFWKKNLSEYFSPLLGVMELQVHDELKRTSPLRLARNKMFVDVVGWSQGAQNAEKWVNNFLLFFVTFVTKNTAGHELRSPN